MKWSKDRNIFKLNILEFIFDSPEVLLRHLTNPKITAIKRRMKIGTQMAKGKMRLFSRVTASVTVTKARQSNTRR